MRDMMLHSSSSSSTIIYALIAASGGLLRLVAAAEVTTEQLYGKLISTAAPAPGFNAEGGSVFTNFADTYNNGQLFWRHTKTIVNEVPDSAPVQFTSLDWCSDLTFSDINNSSLMGYVGRCVGMGLFGYDEAVASGGHLTYSGEWFATVGTSVVFVEQLNVFEGQFHVNTDNVVTSFWDDGQKTMSWILWEGHDEGDMSPSAATSSASGFGESTWMSVEEVALLFNVSVDEFTPETFKQIYKETWIKDHEIEAAMSNPNPEAELAIIEQVKNETNYVDETTAPAQPDNTAAEDGGSDAANPVVEDDSGSGRQLVSVAARFVSAALRVFGI
jgi:hypothetical protein